MDWEDWKQVYYKIVADFQYNQEKELESARKLNDLLKKRQNQFSYYELGKLIHNNIVFIYGCGPSLPKHLELLQNSELILENYIHIAADGATSALLEHKLTPNVVLTDLDGRIPDLITANELGAIVIIHAHGDNIEQLEKFAFKFPGRILGTTQNKPLSNLRNFGGFTDGDRCVYLAEALGASTIILFGFDFGTIVGKYSKPYLVENQPANDIKLKKLRWARDLIVDLSKNRKTIFIRINGHHLKLGNIWNWTFDKLIEFLKNTN